MSKTADDYMMDVIEAVEKGYSCKDIAIRFIEHEMERVKVNGWDEEIKGWKEHLKKLEDLKDE